MIRHFEFYFPSKEDLRLKNSWIQNPFLSSKDKFNHNLQDTLLELTSFEGFKGVWKHSSTFSILDKIFKWTNRACWNCSKTSSSVPFCETGFFPLIIINIKHRNRLDVPYQLQVALLAKAPRLDKLSIKKQVSLWH